MPGPRQLLQVRSLKSSGRTAGSGRGVGSAATRTRTETAGRSFPPPAGGKGGRIESSDLATQARMARSSSHEGGILGEGWAQGLRLPRMGAQPPPGSPRKPRDRPDGKALSLAGIRERRAGLQAQGLRDAALGRGRPAQAGSPPRRPVQGRRSLKSWALAPGHGWPGRDTGQDARPPWTAFSGTAGRAGYSARAANKTCSRRERDGEPWARREERRRARTAEGAKRSDAGAQLCDRGR